MWADRHGASSSSVCVYTHTSFSWGKSWKASTHIDRCAVVPALRECWFVPSPWKLFVGLSPIMIIQNPRLSRSSIRANQKSFEVFYISLKKKKKVLYVLLYVNIYNNKRGERSVFSILLSTDRSCLPVIAHCLFVSGARLSMVARLFLFFFLSL